MEGKMIKWNDKAIKKLETLVKRGLSPTDIGGIFGTSRNAIIGKCSRLKITLAKAKNYNKILKQRSYLKSPIKEPLIKTKTRKFLKVRNTMSDSDKAMGMDIFYKRLKVPPIPDKHNCHFITGDDMKNGNHVWCNRLIHNGSVYCEHHHKIVYVQSYRNKPQNYKNSYNKYIR